MQTHSINILPQIYDLKHDVVIVANGQFPKNPFLQNLIKQAKKIIVCDGALHHLQKKNIEPDFIIGDCDSIRNNLQKKYHHKIIHLAEQDSNDLNKALCLAKEKNLNHILILGATGLREDHTLGNISILAKSFPVFQQIAMVSDYGIFTAHNNNITLPTIPYQQISFFTFSSKTSLSCLELKWVLKNFTTKFWHEVTLNEALGNEINIHITNGIVVVFRAFEINF
ncbi:MAG: thiamine diphosphokinase [Chitinophagaceae bacterium]